MKNIPVLGHFLPENTNLKRPETTVLKIAGLQTSDKCNTVYSLSDLTYVVGRLKLDSVTST